jgi:hypothetical protein
MRRHFAHLLGKCLTLLGFEIETAQIGVVWQSGATDALCSCPLPVRTLCIGATGHLIAPQAVDQFDLRCMGRSDARNLHGTSRARGLVPDAKTFPFTNNDTVLPLHSFVKITAWQAGVPHLTVHAAAGAEHQYQCSRVQFSVKPDSA